MSLVIAFLSARHGTALGNAVQKSTAYTISASCTKSPTISDVVEKRRQSGRKVMR